MSTQYNDLFVRDNFEDTGSVPSPGIASASPDIIPQQSNVFTWATANSTYSGPDQGMEVVNNGVNNIYVRAMNASTTTASSGSVSLYYSPPSLFVSPSSWVQIQGPVGQGSLPLLCDGSASVPKSSVALSNPAFLLTGFPKSDHYCLITVVQTTAHPITIPTSFTTNSAFSDWVTNNPAVGWRNISYHDATEPELIRTFAFANINATAGNFHFKITGEGFTTGTVVTAQCTDATCPINESLTLPAPDDKGKQVTGFDVDNIPAYFSGSLVVTVTSPSGPFPDGASFRISYLQYPSSTDPLDRKASRSMRIERRTSTGPSIVDENLIPIGECRINIVQ